jgi:UDP-glucose 4-epimerase
MDTPTVLVTGSEGAIGRHVVARLLDAGYFVVSLDRVPAQREQTDRSSHVVCDLREVDHVGSIFAEVRPNIVVNMAACLYGSSEKDLKLATDINTVAANDVAEYGVQHGADLVVQFSTKAVYALDRPFIAPTFSAVPEDAPLRPVSNYGISKLASEYAVRRTLHGSATRGAILRMGSTYGPGKGPEHGAVGWLSTLVAAVAAGEMTAVYADESSSSDFIYNVDVAGAVEAICRSYSDWNVQTATMNVASGTLVSVAQLCSVLNEIAGREVAVAAESPDEADISAPPVGLLLDVSRVRNLTGFVPEYGVSSGLRHYHAQLAAMSTA